MYMSVSAAAEKFNISKRRVQTLCEQGRIEGANRMSGVWLIPTNAQKPNDARHKKNINDEQISLFDGKYRLTWLKSVSFFLFLKQQLKIGLDSEN